MSKQPTDFSTEYERLAYTMFEKSGGNPYLWSEVAKERNKTKEIERDR